MKVNPFFRAKHSERLEKRRAYELKKSSAKPARYTDRFNNELARIPGRENIYLVMESGNQIIIKIKYQGQSKWTMNSMFDTFKEAMIYVHECLSYELTDEIENARIF